MPTKRTKGPHGHDQGSHEGREGSAVTGSAVEPDVARARMEAEGIEPDSPLGDPSEKAGQASDGPAT